MVKEWENIENNIRNKNLKEIGDNFTIIIKDKKSEFCCLFYKYCNNKSNIEIFNDDDVQFFKDNNNYINYFNYNDLEIILQYYEDYMFIEKIIKNKDENYEYFLEDYRDAIEKNKIKPLVDYFYNIRYNDITKDENKYCNILEDVYKIVKCIKDRKYKKIRKDDKYSLYAFCKHKNLLEQIFNKDDIDLLLTFG